uniref:Uncharacterized protein n=1 Tax=Anopheles epiroticus TaxID=199890 RepID=A0A182PRG5_9DIPT
MTGEPMTARGTVAGRAPHLQPPHANHPLQALRTDDIEVQVLEQGIELCTSARKSCRVDDILFFWLHIRLIAVVMARIVKPWSRTVMSTIRNTVYGSL